MKKYILIALIQFLLSISLNAQFVASGFVYDENEDPLPGVAVCLEGSLNTATYTNLTGYFALNVPYGSTLSFSMLGYWTQYHPADSFMTVFMYEDGTIPIIEEGSEPEGRLFSRIKSLQYDRERNKSPLIPLVSKL